MKKSTHMKFKGIIATLVLTFMVGANVMAQDSTAVDDCKKFRSLYYEYLKNQKYKDAAYFWQKAITACGEDSLDAGFYTNGSAIYSKLKTEETDTVRLKELDDTLNLCYERYFKYNDDAAKKAEYAAKLISDGSTDTDKIDALLASSLPRLTCDVNSVVIKLYFKYLIMSKFNKAPADKKEEMRTMIIEEYIVLSEYIACGMKKAKEAGNTSLIESQESAQAFIDKYFLLIAKDCEVLTPVLDDKLKTLPQDPEMKLKKVNDYLALMDIQKCQSSATYGKFVDTLILLKPTADAYYFGYIYASGTGNSSKALKYLNKAIELEKDGPNSDKYLLALANEQYKAGSYKAAFSTAQKIGSGEFKGEALYIQAISIAATANSCGNSTFERKANFWLANDYINRAIANGKAGVSSGKFLDNAPSSNEIFSEGITMGSSFTLTCWGESTTVR